MALILKTVVAVNDCLHKYDMTQFLVINTHFGYDLQFSIQCYFINLYIIQDISEDT